MKLETWNNGRGSMAVFQTEIFLRVNSKVCTKEKTGNLKIVFQIIFKHESITTKMLVSPSITCLKPAVTSLSKDGFKVVHIKIVLKYQ